MNKGLNILIGLSASVLLSCGAKNGKYDASGTFEVDEVIVSAELSGKILRFDIEEGRNLAKDSVVGILDAENISLQKQQVEANIQALGEKTSDVSPQVKLLENQLEVQRSKLSNL